MAQHGTQDFKDPMLVAHTYTHWHTPRARRGIDVVRNKIKMFAQKKVTLPPGRHKIVILDEADRCVAERVCVCVCVCVRWGEGFTGV